MPSLIDTDELRDTARRVLDEHLDRRVFLTDDVPVAPRQGKLWALIVELGWLRLAVPEVSGGLGQGFAALSPLFGELGRALSDQPFVGAVLGLDLLCDRAASSVVTPLVEDVMSGRSLVVPVLGLDVPTARRDGTGWVLRGLVRNVLDATDATHLLVPLDAEELALAIVMLPHPAVVVTPRPTWDRSRHIADVAFHELSLPDEALIVRGEATREALARASAYFDLAQAHDALGGASRAFEETLDYMQQRHQFNRPIASFQALKHRCAEHRVGIDASTALLVAATEAAAKQGEGWQTSVVCARLHAGALYMGLSEDCIQLHGGLGFTWDYPCHLFLKRARLGEVLGGTAAQRKDGVAPQLLRRAMG